MLAFTLSVVAALDLRAVDNSRLKPKSAINSDVVVVTAANPRSQLVPLLSLELQNSSNFAFFGERLPVQNLTPIGPVGCLPQVAPMSSRRRHTQTGSPTQQSARI